MQVAESHIPIANVRFWPEKAGSCLLLPQTENTTANQTQSTRAQGHYGLIYLMGGWKMGNVDWESRFPGEKEGVCRLCGRVNWFCARKGGNFTAPLNTRSSPFSATSDSFSGMI
jgi:hypothetical protein